MNKFNFARNFFCLWLFLIAVNAFADNLNIYGQNGIHKTQSAKTLGHGRFGLGFFMEGMGLSDIIKNEQFGNCQSGAGQGCYELTDYMGGNLYPFLSFGLSDYFDFSISMPIYGEYLRIESDGDYKSDNLSAGGIGDLLFSTKIRLIFDKEFPLNMALILGLSLPTGKDGNDRLHGYGAWVRDPIYLNVKSDELKTSYTNKNYIGKAGLATTFDFGKMKHSFPLMFHLNWGIRSVLGKSDYSKVQNIAAALELTPINFLTLFGEFYADMPMKFPKNSDKFSFLDFSTATGGVSFHLSKIVDLQLGAEFLLGDNKKYVNDLYIPVGSGQYANYSGRLIPKIMAFGGITIQLLVIEPKKLEEEPPAAPPEEAPSVIFNANPESVTEGQFVSLNWIVANATEVSIEGIGAVPVQGTKKVKPSETTTYAITAKGPGGSKTEMVEVLVEAAAGPSIVFTSSHESIKPGESVTLTWMINDASEVKIEGVGTVPSNGSRKVKPSETTTYTIVATGKGGTRTEMVEVIVESTPPAIIFTASSDVVQKGQSVTLSWNVSNATEVNLEGVGPVQAQGTRRIKLSENKTFVLTATGSGGTQTAMVDVEVEEIAKKVNLKGVNFLSGKAELTLDAKRVLDDVAEQLLASPEVKIEIHGHTDSQGSAKSNKDLSERRAKAVVGYLASKGVKTSRMQAIGFGPDVPIADNKTAEGRELNRRIEMIRVD